MNLHGFRPSISPKDSRSPVLTQLPGTVPPSHPSLGSLPGWDNAEPSLVPSPQSLRHSWVTGPPAWQSWLWPCLQSTGVWAFLQPHVPVPVHLGCPPGLSAGSPSQGEGPLCPGPAWSTDCMQGANYVRTGNYSKDPYKRGGYRVMQEGNSVWSWPSPGGLPGGGSTSKPYRSICKAIVSLSPAWHTVGT